MCASMACFAAARPPVQWNTDKRSLASLGLDFRGERVRLVDRPRLPVPVYRRRRPALGLANGVPLPWAPDARTSQGGPWGYIERKDAWAVLRGEVDVTDRITFYAAAGARDNRDQYQLPRTLTITNVNGNGTASPAQPQFLLPEPDRHGRHPRPRRHRHRWPRVQRQRHSRAADLRRRRTFGPGYATNIYSPTYIPFPNLPTPQANFRASPI